MAPRSRRSLPAGAGPILALALSPDGKTILVGSSDRTARLVARSSGKVLHTLPGHNGPVRSVAFSPGGDHVATADDLGGLKVWETATGVGVIAFGHASAGAAAKQPRQKVAFTRRWSPGLGFDRCDDQDLDVRRIVDESTRRSESHVFRVLALDFARMALSWPPAAASRLARARSRSGRSAKGCSAARCRRSIPTRCSRCGSAPTEQCWRRPRPTSSSR